MLRSFKKLVSLMLVLALSLAISMPAFAASANTKNGITLSQNSDGSYTLANNRSSAVNNNSGQKLITVYSIDETLYKTDSSSLLEKMDEKTFVPVREIEIDPYDQKQVDSVTSNKQIFKETVEEIKNFVTKCQKGEIKAYGHIKVYLPKSNANGKTIALGGYGNKTYYNQTTYYPLQSDIVDIESDYGDWKTYFSNGVQVAAELLVDNAMDTITLGKWSISKAVILGIVPGSVPSTTDYKHRAEMKADKYVKNTYVVEGGQNYFGAHTETATARFKNYACFPGYSSDDYDLGWSTSFSKTTPNYNSPEQKAYYCYMGSGWTEYVSNFLYNGYSFSC